MNATTVFDNTARPLALCLALAAMFAVARQNAWAQNQNPPAAQAPGQQPAVELWGDEFDGDRLDETKWELHTFEGGGGKTEVRDNLLKMRGAGGSRSGVRSKQSFKSERFYVEAALAKVGGQLPQPGAEAHQAGYGILTILFDGNSNNRLEWILRSDGLMEAWAVVDGRMERLDNRKLATKEKDPRLGIARRGDKFYFMLNRQVGLEHKLSMTASSFRVMLYGFGSTESHWDSLYVQTSKQ